jgi:hypothetical protein
VVLQVGASLLHNRSLLLLPYPASHDARCTEVRCVDKTTDLTAANELGKRGRYNVERIEFWPDPDLHESVHRPAHMSLVLLRSLLSCTRRLVASQFRGQTTTTRGHHIGCTCGEHVDTGTLVRGVAKDRVGFGSN